MPCLEAPWGPAFSICIHTSNQDEGSSCFYAQVSVLSELILGHLHYSLIGVMPPNTEMAIVKTHLEALKQEFANQRETPL